MGALDLPVRTRSAASKQGDPQGLIRDEGTSEVQWQAWSGLHAIRTIPLEKWIHPSARLVVVAPHPDDEILACGGLLRQHTERGGKTLVIGVTDGEASHAGQPAWQASQLAVLRHEERLTGLSRLGCGDTEICRLGLQDGKVAGQAGELEAALQKELRWGDIVVSTWRLDGHPDHGACGLAAARACSAVHCRLLEAPVWMWQWGLPNDQRVPWHRLVGLPLTNSAMQAKQKSISAHVSQLEPRSASQAPVLGRTMLERFSRRVEYFFA